MPRQVIGNGHAFTPVALGVLEIDGKMEAVETMQE
jgi:hypothetical protein